MEECSDSVTEGEERIRWDKQQCIELFKDQNIRVTDTEIKFCRRVGPRKDRDRPLVVGFRQPGREY
jgi:hypothetical protein